MTYFAANGAPLGNIPPQAQAGVGRYFGRDDPQAAANGIGRFGRIGRLGMLPPQAQAGLGRFGMIGMLPPQAQAGVGDDMTPSGIPEGEPHAWREGILGTRRQPEPFAQAILPWRDGVFGPGLGIGLGADINGPTVDLGSPDVATEVKIALNLLVTSYSVTPGGTYDQATEAAYVSFVEEQTPGYSDKGELYQLVGGRRYPSARGIYVLMQSARVAWQADVGLEESYARVESFYPILWAFSLAFEQAGYSGTVVTPAPAAGSAGPSSSTVALWGLGAVGIGLAAVVVMKPKGRRKVSSNPRRRRRRR